MRHRFLALRALAALAVATGGCVAIPWKARPEPAPTLNPTPLTTDDSVLVHGPLVIEADFHLAPDDPLVTELVAEQRLISDRLGIEPGDAKIYVRLFASEAEYRERVVRQFPEFQQRRAIFFESGGQLHVYAHWSDRVAEDLRHEVAHGYLHAAAPGLPLWLDEGLAEFFEVGDGGRGRHAEHLALLDREFRAGRWRPDLARLESITSASAMQQLDYAEAWLWVHYLLDDVGNSRHLLLAQLVALHRGQSIGGLADEMHRLEPGVDAALLSHLAALVR